LLLAAGGCATTGTFVAGPWYLTETLELRDDGSFRYELWSDDGGTVCVSEGTWRRVPDEGGRKAVVTTVAFEAARCEGLPEVER
jgi:hypothetical protein